MAESGFQAMLRGDSSALFCNPDDFGEAVSIMLPTGATRTGINVLVDRHPAERIDANGQVYTPKMIVHIANDSTAGISSSEFDPAGTWKMLIAERIGGTAAYFGIYAGSADDQGKSWIDSAMLKLELK